MGRKRRPPLVTEIGRLLFEYPKKDWLALADRLRDRVLMDEIATAIDDAVAMADASVKRTRSYRRNPRESVLGRVARRDKAKAEKLARLKVATERQRPTLATRIHPRVRQFAWNERATNAPSR